MFADMLVDGNHHEALHCKCACCATTLVLAGKKQKTWHTKCYLSKPLCAKKTTLVLVLSSIWGC